MIRSGLAGGMLLMAVAGCADRQASIDAAMALAEAAYPGQLELYDTHLQKDHYDVTLAIRGDPVTRIRFNVDRDPARCQPATPCEERLRRAYARGIAAGDKLKALRSVLAGCGVRTVGMDNREITPDFTTIIELDLDVADQQPGLDRLTPCIAAFRNALPPDATPVQQGLALRILLPSGRATGVGPLTFETRLPAARSGEPSYLAKIGPDDTGLVAADLRLNQHYLSRSEVREALADAARQALADSPRGGHVPELSFAWKARLDPQRLDMIRTYILACSQHEAGKGPCKTDIAVRMRYDLNSGEVSEIGVLRGIRGAGGEMTLPPLPGRGA